MDITSLPDLALLEVFANIPLDDLFSNQIPLVCRNWYRLWPVALRGRRRLHLSQAKELLRFRVLDSGALPVDKPDPVTILSDRCDSMHWCSLSDDNKRFKFSKTEPIHRLSLPGDTDGSEQDMDPIPLVLSSEQMVDRLARTMPRLTELVVVDSWTIAGDEGVISLAVSNLARLLGHYTTSLTVLRLHLNGSGPAVEKALDGLVAAINTLARLHTLQLHLDNKAVKNLSESFSRAMLVRLRRLVVIEPDLKEWTGFDRLFRELKSSRTQIHLNPALVIVCEPSYSQERGLPGFLLPSGSGSAFAATAASSGHVRVASVHSARDLRLACDHLHRLTSLRVSIDYFELKKTFHQVLAMLAPALPELTRLSVWSLPLLHCAWDETEPLSPLPVLVGVRRLTLVPRLVLEEPSTTVARHQLGHCFPALEHLELQLKVLFKDDEGRTRIPQQEQCKRAVLQQLDTECSHHLTTVQLKLSGPKLVRGIDFGVIAQH